MLAYGRLVKVTSQVDFESLFDQQTQAIEILVEI